MLVCLALTEASYRWVPPRWRRGRPDRGDGVGGRARQIRGDRFRHQRAGLRQSADRIVETIEPVHKFILVVPYGYVRGIVPAAQ